MSHTQLLRLILLFFFLVLTGYFIWWSPAISLESSQFPYLVHSLLLLSFLILSFGRGRLKPSDAMKYAFGWIVIFLVVFTGYSFREEATFIFNRLHQNLIPAVTHKSPDGSLTIMRQSDGHFYVQALVNDVPVKFMIDTGATRTTLNLTDAKRVNINMANLEYNQLSQTANGLVRSAPLSLDKIQVGDITVLNVNGSVNNNLLGHSLLGMSFLDKLKEFRIEGDRLTIKG